MRSWEILVSSWDALVSSWGSLVSSWGVLVSSWAGLVSSSMYKSPRSSRGSSRGLLRSSRVLRRNSPGLRRNSRGLRRLPRDAEELSRELPRAAEEHPRAAEELPRDADSSNKKLICNTRRMPLDEVSAKRFWNSLLDTESAQAGLLLKFRGRDARACALQWKCRVLLRNSFCLPGAYWEHPMSFHGAFQEPEPMFDFSTLLSEEVVKELPEGLLQPS